MQEARCCFVITKESSMTVYVKNVKIVLKR